MVPEQASSAVTQVPMFCPKRMNMAPCRGISPSPARACRMPTLAEEDWMSAVMAAPTSTPTKGLLTPMMASRNNCQSRSGAMAEDMVFMPTNRMPRPMVT